MLNTPSLFSTLATGKFPRFPYDGRIPVRTITVHGDSAMEEEKQEIGTEVKRGLPAWLRPPTQSEFWWAVIPSLIASALILFLVREKRELSYYVKPVSSIVYDAEDADGHLLVPVRQDSGGNRVFDTDAAIEDSVYSIQMQFWNSGNIPIKSDEVTVPITLEMVGAANPISSKILEVNNEPAKIRIADNRSLSGVSTDPEFNVPLTNIIELDWKMLEPGDAAVIQLTYTKDGEATVELKGQLQGKRKIINYNEAVRSKIDAKSVLSMTVNGVIGLMIVFGVIMNRKTLFNRPMSKTDMALNGFLIPWGLMLAVSLYFVAAFFLDPFAGPPIDF